MRRITESGAILDAVAAATGASRERVAVVVTALRDAIDGLFLDGYSIFAPPFSITYRDDPVAPIFAERIDSATEEDAEPWRVGNLEATAEWLGVPLTTYMRHPVASPLMVLVELFDGLDIEDADSPEGAEAVAIAEAWFDTFENERPYRLGNVGLERDLEAWLIHNTERLGLIGYDVRLRKQQLVLPDRRRPDLVFDLIEQDGSTGTLIVELKATGGYLEAVDQLVGYMDAFASLGLVEGVLRGLLVADGFPPRVLAYADEKGIDTATLRELGYRRDLAAAPTTARPSPQSAVGAEPEASMKKFVGVTLNQYDESDKGKPVLVFNAKSVQDPPESIEPYDDSMESKQLAAQWSSFIQGPGKDHTVGQLAMRLGGITYADGSPIESAEATPERPRRRVARRGEQPATANPRVYRMFHGMDSDRSEPLATLVFGDTGICRWVSDNDAFATFYPGHIYRLTLDQIAGSMTSRVFVPVDEDDPDYLDTQQSAPEHIPFWEAAGRATGAGADFLRAVWRLRENLTFLPPRQLADYLRRNPDELRGDDELPEHIEAAADAFEALPTVVIGWDQPEHYDGSPEDFLLDAEHVFESVAARLRQLGDHLSSHD